MTDNRPPLSSFFTTHYFSELVHLSTTTIQADRRMSPNADIRELSSGQVQGYVVGLAFSIWISVGLSPYLLCTEYSARVFHTRSLIFVELKTLAGDGSRSLDAAVWDLVRVRYCVSFRFLAYSFLLLLSCLLSKRLSTSAHHSPSSPRGKDAEKG